MCCAYSATSWMLPSTASGSLGTALTSVGTSDRTEFRGTPGFSDGNAPLSGCSGCATADACTIGTGARGVGNWRSAVGRCVGTTLTLTLADVALVFVEVALLLPATSRRAPARPSCVRACLLGCTIFSSPGGGATPFSPDLLRVLVGPDVAAMIEARPAAVLVMSDIVLDCPPATDRARTLPLLGTAGFSLSIKALVVRLGARLVRLICGRISAVPGFAQFSLDVEVRIARKERQAVR
mmetsp:Transcript_65188/g.172714  ORF Transcript_65188/g.172714 Transcript_65188/m.172714 type:complete len:238 (-) Transcript_65188:59-772(-)